MTILITGGAGQLAGDLNAQLGPQGLAVARAECDITSQDSIEAALSRHQPNVVINCAAYNAVDLAEQEPEAAFAVNAFGPRNLAAACAARGTHLTHISTDYVFTGADDDSRAWTEADCPSPASAYATSKLAGEQFVMSAGHGFAVVRTCGLYGQHGGNFVKTMLRLGQTKEEVRVVADQRCTPTATSDLATWLIALAERRSAGLFHATNSGHTTWAEFAAKIFDIAGLPTRVVPISSEEFGAAATRPTDSVLVCSRLDTEIEMPRRSWPDALKDFITTACPK